MFPPSKKSKQTQVIEDRYIDEDKLLEVCEQRFGIDNYRLKVRTHKNVEREKLILTLP
jgi:hypothetical protein